MQSFIISNGKRHVGPVAKEKLLTSGSSGQLASSAFVLMDQERPEWHELSTVDWWQESPKQGEFRYCPECDARIQIAKSNSADSPRNCPQCFQKVKLLDYLRIDDLEHLGHPIEPWGKYDILFVTITVCAVVISIIGSFALLFDPSLAILLGFIALTTAIALFTITYQHRRETSKFRQHLKQIETLLSARTTKLAMTTSELIVLKRSVQLVKEDLVREFEQEANTKRMELEEKLQLAHERQGAVDRMAKRFLDETQKWWSSKLNAKNYQATKDRVQKSIDFCEKQGYLVPEQLKKEILKQLQTDYEHAVRLEEEKERQREIREKIREEQRAERELKREMERIEAEQRAIENALNEALTKAHGEHSAEVEALQRRLDEAIEKGQRAVSQAQLTKAGHVYVISNHGSFGENTYKVGLTRRLQPLDRIKELGDASVPFPFDVHMMIASDDAPTLENTLHKALHRHRVNRVNFRKEFFRVELDTIRKIVEQHHGVVEYTADAEALEYRQSLSISDEDFDFLANVAEELGMDNEDDDHDGADAENSYRVSADCNPDTE